MRAFWKRSDSFQKSASVFTSRSLARFLPLTVLLGRLDGVRQEHPVQPDHVRRTGLLRLFTVPHP